MPLTAAEFRDAVKVCSSHAEMMDLVESQLFDRLPVAFSTEEELFLAVRAHLEKTLGAEPESVGLVGSAALGFSIAPQNFTRDLLPGSDLDFVVISPALFDRYWHVLLRWGHPVRHHVPRDAEKWFNSRKDEIFWGWLDPEKLHFRGVNRPRLLRELRGLQQVWFETFRSLGGIFPGTQVATRPVSARLYRSKMHLLHYQANGLMKTRLRLLKDAT